MEGPGNMTIGFQGLWTCSALNCFFLQKPILANQEANRLASLVDFVLGLLLIVEAKIGQAGS